MSIHNIKSSKEFGKYLESNDYVIVKFSAKWCAPCKQISPKYKSLAIEFTNLKFTEIDVDEIQVEDISKKYKVTAIPDFMSISRGQEKDRFTGANIEKLKKMVSSLEEDIPLKECLV